MKKVEKESLFKSFLLFFISQTILIGALFFIDFTKVHQTFDAHIFSQMRICSFNLQCKKFKIAFVPKNGHELYKLYKDTDELSAYFTIHGSQKNYLKIYLQKIQYKKQISKLKKELFINFALVLLIVIILSFIFAFYTLFPLRNALHLMEEFIKDILHDFNTPLTTLRLNVSMLKHEFGENQKITRIENSVHNILNLQANLRAYLRSTASQKEQFDLENFIKERVRLIDAGFKHLKFIINIKNVTLKTNKNAFSRIIDNLISNAAKYNKKNGKIIIKFEKNILKIEDTGKGIKVPKKVFDRFYKEQERGMGIGLHIVKKLCDELNIDITLNSIVDKGTTFKLNLTNISLVHIS